MKFYTYYVARLGHTVDVEARNKRDAEKVLRRDYHLTWDSPIVCISINHH